MTSAVVVVDQVSPSLKVWGAVSTLQTGQVFPHSKMAKCAYPLSSRKLRDFAVFHRFHEARETCPHQVL